MESIGKKLRECRTKLGLTQEAAAAQIGVAHNTYARYELDLRRPTAENLMKMANFFGVSVAELMGYNKPDAAEPDEGGAAISDDELRFALWGGDADQITPEQLEEVKKFAAFVLMRDKK